MGLRTQASSLGDIPVKTQKQILRKQAKLSRIEIHFFRKDDSLAEKVFYPAAKLSAAGKHTMAHVANLVRDLDSL